MSSFHFWFNGYSTGTTCACASLLALFSYLVNSAVQVALILIIMESLELVYGHIMATNGSSGFQNGYFWWHGKVDVCYIYTQNQQPYIESLWHSQPQTLSLNPCFKKLVLKEWCHFLFCAPNHFLFWLVSKLVLSLCSFSTGNLHAHPVSLIQGQIAKLFLASGPLWVNLKPLWRIHCKKYH